MPLKFNEYSGAAKPTKALFFLHGYNSNPSVIRPWATQLAADMQDMVTIIPEAPFAGAGAGNRQWFGLTNRYNTHAAGNRHGLYVMSYYPESVPQLNASAVALNQFIDERLDAHGIDDSNMILAGFSQGAITALYAGLRRSKDFAAIMAFSGCSVEPNDTCFLTPVSPQIFLSHGRSDTEVPFMNHIRTVHLLQTNGFVPICHTRDDLGHEIGRSERIAAKGFMKIALSGAASHITRTLAL